MGDRLPLEDGPLKKKILFLWAANPIRACLEGLLLSALFLLALWPINGPYTNTLTRQTIILICILAPTLVGLRCQPLAENVFLGGIFEIILSLIFALLLNLEIFGVLALINRIPDFGSLNFVLVLLGISPVFLGIRFLIWLGRTWSRLRRKHFLWQLTHCACDDRAAAGRDSLIFLFPLFIKL